MDDTKNKHTCEESKNSNTHGSLPYLIKGKESRQYRKIMQIKFFFFQ